MMVGMIVFLCVCVCSSVHICDWLQLSASPGLFLIDHYWVLWRWKGCWELISRYESWVSGVWCEYLLITLKESFHPVSILSINIPSSLCSPRSFLFFLAFSFFFFHCWIFFLSFRSPTHFFPFPYLFPPLLFMQLSRSLLSFAVVCFPFHLTPLNSSPILSFFPFLPILSSCLCGGFFLIFSFLSFHS